MSDILADGGEAVFALLKTQGVPAITSSLESLSSSATEGWQKSLLKLGVSLVADHGQEGLSILEDSVQKLQNGKTVDLSKLSMEEASDLLAVMQRREADTRNRIALYTQVVVETIGKALATLVSILFKEIKL